MQLTPALPPAVAPRPDKPTQERDKVLLEKARDLEAAFLAEMLSYAGLGQNEGAFSGGVGEEQFASFLRQEQARLLVEKGGIGLAEQLFRSLTRDQNVSG